MQGDRNRLLAVLRFTAAASAGFEFATLVLVHDALDSFLLSRALTGHELSSFAVHSARATNEMLYKFLNRRVFTASKCRFLLGTASFFIARTFKARNEVLGSTTICDRNGIRDQDSYSRSAVARRDSWRIRHARPNLNDSSVLPIYGRNRASNVGGIRQKRPVRKRLSIEVDASNRPA